MDHLKTFNPLQYWKDLWDHKKFRILPLIAFRFISSPCASSFCERIFSGGGHISSMCSAEVLEMRIQLSHNMHILEEDCGVVNSSDMGIRLSSLGDPEDIEGDDITSADVDEEC